jgi:pseudouridine-5'-phosphate glycosidase
VLTVARSVGIRFLGTGGIGGVHRGYPQPPDVSADSRLARHLPRARDVLRREVAARHPATTEQLETLGIPVLGFRTDTMPLFYEADGGPP